MSIQQARVVVIFIGMVLFLPSLGSVHLFDWDEINFAESAREMIVTGDYWRVQINFQPFWEKPPLFIWCQVLAMKIFGINEFAARFPNAITGIFTLLFIFNVGNRLHSMKFGLLWVLAYIGTFLSHFYFKSGIIDPLFNLFILCGIVYLHDAFEHKKIIVAIRAGFFVGLAILTKGPVALAISGICLFIYLIMSRDFSWKSIFITLVFSFFALFIAGLWFGIETLKHGTWFIEEFIKYNIRLFNTEDSGHGQPVYYHPLVLMVGCFPASIWMLNTLFKPLEEQNAFSNWMKILFWTVLIIFSIVKTKIVHYTSLCYFPITYLAALFIYNYAAKEHKTPKYVVFMMSLVGLIISSAIMAVSFIPKYKNIIIPFIKDRFAVANIKNEVVWSGYEYFIGIFMLLSVLVAVFYYKNILIYSSILFLTSCLTLQLVFYFIVPKIEKHLQGQMIDFFKSTQSEDCYVKVIGFKNYAQYFYTNRKPAYHSQAFSENENEFMYGKIDKPVYFLTKCDRDHYRTIPELNVILDTGGYVVYKRLLKKEE